MNDRGRTVTNASLSDSGSSACRDVLVQNKSTTPVLPFIASTTSRMIYDALLAYAQTRNPSKRWAYKISDKTIKMADSILEKLNISISATTNDPSVPLDQPTFEEAELVLAEILSPEHNLQLVSSLSALLPNLQQDPAPAVDLLLRLINRYSYGDILKLGSIPFKDGLAVGEHMSSYNRLIISILNKAASNAADAASVAGLLETVLALVQLWLCTSDTGVAISAQQLLLDLLKIDQQIQTGPDSHLPSGGQGLMWKRLFGDQDVYRMFFEACSFAKAGSSPLALSKSQRTLAQARLMEWLPKVAGMDWNAVTRSNHPEIEADFKSQGGLLGFATSHMLDTKDDVLMYRCLIDFYSEILDETRPKAANLGNREDSVGLRYLIAEGVHARTVAIYLQLPGAAIDPLEAMFLYGPAANYIATYASNYPTHFMASQLPQQVNTRLGSALDQSPAKWAHAESPKHDLHLLASLPRSALLPGPRGWHASPLSLVPSKATNPDALNTLATVFHGPDRDIIFGSASPATTDSEVQKESALARALYHHYLSFNPRLWQDIANHADTVALKDLALSAINVLVSVTTANWSEAPDVDLPVTIVHAPSGHVALLSPPAVEYTMPYLLKPPRTFANLVGGRGDAESSAYKIAAAKFDALRALNSRLEAQVQQTPGAGYEDILRTISRKLAEGPLSREGEVGGRIATLEL